MKNSILIFCAGLALLFQPLSANLFQDGSPEGRRRKTHRSQGESDAPPVFEYKELADAIGVDTSAEHHRLSPRRIRSFVIEHLLGLKSFALWAALTSIPFFLWKKRNQLDSIHPIALVYLVLYGPLLGFVLTNLLDKATSGDEPSYIKLNNFFDKWPVLREKAPDHVRKIIDPLYDRFVFLGHNCDYGPLISNDLIPWNDQVYEGVRGSIEQLYQEYLARKKRFYDPPKSAEPSDESNEEGGNEE